MKFPTIAFHICRRPAMNTLFEIIVSGDELENDVAAAEAAFDEIARIETVLSRFDPASEVARVNREAHRHPVLVSYELLEILELCQDYREKTFGYFDITAGSGALRESAAELHSAESRSNPACNLFSERQTNKRFLPSATRQRVGGLIINSAERKIFFTEPELRLDFGAFGKGYALDCAAKILKDNGVQNALLHGGTSSVLSTGTDPECCRVSLGGPGWTIGLRNPWNVTEEIESVFLQNQSLSTSAVFPHGQNTSDIINPHQRTHLRDNAACVVIGGTAAESEIYSTALLCMGREIAEKFCAENLSLALQVFWIEKDENGAPVCNRLLTSLSEAPVSGNCEFKTHSHPRDVGATRFIRRVF